MDIGHWSYHSEFNPEEYEGFVYIITNKLNNRQYIGMKVFYYQRMKKVKGKIRKKKYMVPSKWQSYTGSSEGLNDDIEAFGKDNFTFEILRLCQKRLRYWEENYQHKYDVLTKMFDNGDPAFYNITIGNRHHRHTDKTRNKISKAQIGPLNHRYGKTCSDDHKKKISEALTGHPGYWLGKTTPNARGCIVHGIKYKSHIKAGEALGLSRQTISKRINDPLNTDYRKLD